MEAHGGFVAGAVDCLQLAQGWPLNQAQWKRKCFRRLCLVKLALRNAGRGGKDVLRHIGEFKEEEK